MYACKKTSKRIKTISVKEVNATSSVEVAISIIGSAISNPRLKIERIYFNMFSIKVALLSLSFSLSFSTLLNRGSEAVAETARQKGHVFLTFILYFC